MSSLDVPIERVLFGPGVNSTTRLDAFLNWATWERSGEEFWRAFHLAWTSADATWSCRDQLLERLEQERDFSEACEWLPDAESRAFFASLPPWLKVYRGCEMDRVMGLAWTTERRVALEFARGHRGMETPNPIIASASVAKSDIFAAHADRQEFEIVVSPLRLKGIRVRHCNPVQELRKLGGDQ